jgi:predicted transcriptional regulator
MSHKPPRSEENSKTTWKVKKLVKRQEDTLKEVQRLKEEKEMQQSESHKSKNIP